MRRVMNLLSQLLQWQIDLLMLVLEGHAALVYTDDVEAYALVKEGESTGMWKFHHLREQLTYTVTMTGCTCPDNKFRHRVCKHMRRVEAL